MKWAWLVLAMGVLLGCASPGSVLPPAPVTAAALLSGERLSQPIPAPADSTHWLTISPEMQAFLSTHAPQNSPRASALELVAGLVTALQPSGGFTYQADAVFTASEAFERRRANCLSFSAMMISLLREAGIEASFQRIEVIPGLDVRGEFAMRSHHVNTLVVLEKRDHIVIDWPYQGDRARAVALVSDQEALAEHHNNLGAEALVINNPMQGFAEMRRALELSPNLAHLWSNLAVVYLRLNDLAAAESAWLEALWRDAAQPSALGGLQRLYELDGRSELAAELEKHLRREQDKDPYYHYLAARRAIDQREWRAARESLSSALALRNDPRFRQLLAELDRLENAPYNALRNGLENAGLTHYQQ